MKGWRLREEPGWRSAFHGAEAEEKE
jgi:hypothetical protein